MFSVCLATLDMGLCNVRSREDGMCLFAIRPDAIIANKGGCASSARRTDMTVCAFLQGRADKASIS